MSVVRSAYRQILRVGVRAQRMYEDPNDLCFAVFGILLNRNDLANAGYGTGFRQAVRHAFERPSILGDASDSPSARLQAGFALLRRLNDLAQHKTPRAVRQRREEVLSATSVAAKLPPAQRREEEEEDVQVRVKDGQATVTRRQQTITIPASGRGAVAVEAESEVTEGRAADAKVDEDVREEEEEDTDDDDSVMVGTTTLLLDRSQNRKVQQEVRHVVVSRVKEHFPPYTYLLPPEPMYPLAVTQQFPFFICKDTVVCMAATSLLLKQQQAKREQEEAAAALHGSLRKPGTKGGDSAPLGTAVTFPTSREGFQELLRTIPTRAIARTDFMEVEVCTQHICSYPPSSSSSSSSSSASASGGAPPPALPSPRQRPGDAAADSAKGGSAKGSAKLFMCYVFIRNLPAPLNPQMWHAQLLSQHFTVLDAECNEVTETARPGVVGNFPLLAPGESHVFEFGASQHGTEGILRGTLQVNAFNERGRMRVMDIALPPVRLSTQVFQHPFHKGGPEKSAAEAAAVRTPTLASDEGGRDSDSG